MRELTLALAEVGAALPDAVAFGMGRGECAELIPPPKNPRARYMPGPDKENPEIGERFVPPGHRDYMKAVRRDAKAGDEKAKEILRRGRS